MMKKNNTLLEIILFVSVFIPSLIFGQLDTIRFYDSAHHWYDINDAHRVINPLSDRPQYSSLEIEKIADNILLFQKDNGGWAKNYDMQAILSFEQVDKVIKAKGVLNTTFDNGATHSQTGYLAEVFLKTRKEKYREAFIKGVEYILSSQYSNGGWPQYFPDTSGYRKYITFNDGAMIGIMQLLYRIVSTNSLYEFIPKELIIRIEIAFKKGLECILNLQIIENNKLLVWCQQHDNVTLEPQNARTFEPASICNGESSEIVLFLMQLENPNDRIINSVKNAVKWFEESAINGIRVERVNAPKIDFQYHTSTWDRVLVQDEDAPRIWTRFYELKTHVPMFCRRDGRVVYKLSEVARERRTGYSWYHYAPERVLEEYLIWRVKWKVD